MESRFQALRQELSSIVQDCCRTLEGTPLRMRQWVVISRQGNGISYKPETRATFNLRFERNMISSSIRDQIINALAAEPQITIDLLGSSIEPACPVTDEQRERLFAYLVSPFVSEYFRQASNFAFNETVFESVFTRLVADLISPTITCLDVSALRNLDLAEDSFDVSPGIRLRRSSIEEFESWYNDPYVSINSHGTFIGPDDLTTVLEVTYERARVERVSSGAVPAVATAINVRDRVVQALQLLTGQNVQFYFTQETGESIIWNRGATYGNLYSQHDIPGKATKELLERLTRILPKLEDPSLGPRFDLAVHRWQSGLARRTHEDRLIDYWIALEALFANDTNTEVTYRASLRIAAFLGRTPENRIDLLSDMKKSYGWRSNIAHGKRPEKAAEAAALTKALVDASAALQETLLRIFDAGATFDPVEIEKEMLRASAPEPSPASS